MSPTVVRERRRSSGVDTRRLVVLVVAVLAGGALAAVLWWSILRPPAFVDGVTLVNDSVYDVHVEVSGRPDGPVLGLGTVPRGGRSNFGAVLDQGETWVFRFKYAGRAGGEITVDRDDLERSGWTVTVPRHVERELRRQGLPPSVSSRAEDSGDRR